MFLNADVSSKKNTTNKDQKTNKDNLTVKTVVDVS